MESGVSNCKYWTQFPRNLQLLDLTYNHPEQLTNSKTTMTDTKRENEANCEKNDLPHFMLFGISRFLEPTSRLYASSTCKAWGVMLHITPEYTPTDRHITTRMQHAMIAHHPGWCTEYAIAQGLDHWGPRIRKMANDRLKYVKGNTKWKNRAKLFKAIKAGRRERIVAKRRRIA